MLLLLLACTEPDPIKPPPTDSGEGETDSTDSGPTDSPTGEPDVCDTLGLPRRAWEDAADSSLLNSTAADVSFELIDGSEWRLSENWTGCETYLFVPGEPAQNQGFPDHYWESKRDFKAFFKLLPANTRVIFVSEQQANGREEQLAALETMLADALDGLDSDSEDWWNDGRVLIAADRPAGIDGWLGDSLTSPGWGVAVDRFQKIRYVGSFADPSRYDSNVGWFAPNFEMLANEPIYYNFEAERQQWVDALDGEVLTVLDGVVVQDGSWSGATTEVLVDIPDLSVYDALYLDLTSACQGDGEYGYCPAWDYINWLWICEPDGTECAELGRWITTYHREGRWVHDVSPLLPLLGEGGNQKLLRYYSQQPYETTLHLRFATEGRDDRATGLDYLFNGGTLGSSYNLREPVSVTVPSDVSRVELVTVLTGHGMDSVGNCAEFCEISHHFTVNGELVEVTFPIEDSERGCMAKANVGTVPNQYGTWWYGRNGWCPGQQVDVGRVDVTAWAAPGDTVTVEYDAYYRGADFTGGSANIDGESWLVYYR